MKNNENAIDERNKVILVVVICLALLFLAVYGILSSSGNEEEIVYITTYGDRYHSENCRYLHGSSIVTTKNDAILAGFGACEYCKGKATTIVVDNQKNKFILIGVACAIDAFLIYYCLTYNPRKEDEEVTE